MANKGPRELSHRRMCDARLAESESTKSAALLRSPGAEKSAECMVSRSVRGGLRVRGPPVKFFASGCSGQPASQARWHRATCARREPVKETATKKYGLVSPALMGRIAFLGRPISACVHVKQSSFPPRWESAAIGVGRNLQIARLGECGARCGLSNQPVLRSPAAMPLIEI